jgi:hypothetical protein
MHPKGHLRGDTPGAPESFQMGTEVTCSRSRWAAANTASASALVSTTLPGRIKGLASEEKKGRFVSEEVKHGRTMKIYLRLLAPLTFRDAHLQTNIWCIEWFAGGANHSAFAFFKS